MKCVTLKKQPVFYRGLNIAFWEVLSTFPYSNVSTQAVIDGLEQTGEIIDYDLFLIKEVVKYISQLKSDCKFSMNISPQTVEHSHDICRILSTIPPNIRSRLIIEITENGKPCDIEKFRNVAANLGVKVALDDYNLKEFDFGHVCEFCPDIFKLVVNDMNLEELEYWMWQARTFRTIVFEHVTREQADLIWKNLPQALIQSYHLGEPEKILYNLEYR